MFWYFDGKCYFCPANHFAVGMQLFWQCVKVICKKLAQDAREGLGLFHAHWIVRD